MRKVILYIATSKDGFIAKENGDTSWLHSPKFELKDEDFGYSKMLESCDTNLMGYTTYAEILKFDMPFPYPNHKNIIFSKNQFARKVEFATITNDNPVELVQNLKQEKGKNIWLIGGGKINQLLLDANLIDTVILTVVPEFIEKGIPLFSGNGNLTGYKVQETLTFPNGFVQTHYTK